MISRISMGRSLIVVAIFVSDNTFLDTRVERSEKNHMNFGRCPKFLQSSVKTRKERKQRSSFNKESKLQKGLSVHDGFEIDSVSVLLIFISHLLTLLLPPSIFLIEQKSKFGASIQKIFMNFKQKLNL